MKEEEEEEGEGMCGGGEGGMGERRGEHGRRRQAI